ncbi:SDR family NAD(P)-dependent oxidoreductase [Sphingomonas sp.]|uniref:SDR family NAD(P)-dependent oxidoreductase n=1 Tax=Sphingomonas sp. TaxID=28214 RepID=UPI001836CA67|nr:SDR family NAD(P)-dependent oxidoreductase [Sphingomonas sp.]MBA4761823.1 SDR family NAD(P)-dependent oxidoreductase [Sphingomonas sp.]
MTETGAAKRRVCLVTGGTSGIGRAFVDALHRRGDDVRFCARSPDAVAAVEAALPGSTGYVCDVTDDVALAAMTDLIAIDAGRLDLLVANAGRLVEMNFNAAPLDPALIEADIALNLVSPILTINRCLPLLLRGEHSAIVLTGSGFGWSPTARAPLYSGAKAGVRMFAKALGAQLAPAGVTVTELVPPPVDTPAVAHRNVAKLSPEHVVAATLRGVERGRRAVFPGHARFLPLGLRLVPQLIERMTLKS